MDIIMIDRILRGHFSTEVVKYLRSSEIINLYQTNFNNYKFLSSNSYFFEIYKTRRINNISIGDNHYIPDIITNNYDLLKYIYVHK
jgi:hypothetical protein